VISAVREVVNKRFKHYLKVTDLHCNLEHALHFFEEFSYSLCRKTRTFLVLWLSTGLLRTILKEANLIKPEGQWYSGRPIMITRNDYNLRLFNGDVGIIP